MKLNGNNLIVGALLSASAIAANADISAPDLNEFTAGTPAKAAEVNENFEGLKAYSESMQELIQAQALLIEELENKAENLESQNTALSSRTTLLENQNTTLRNQVSALETADTTLSNRINQNTGLVNSVSTRTASLETLTTALSTDVETLITDSAGLATRVSTLETSADAINTKVTALETSATTLDSRTTTLETQTTALEASNTTLTTRTTSAEDSISDLTARLNLLETEPVVDENGNPYTIAVYGDDQLIGYASAVPELRTSGKMIIKTALGFVRLEGGYNNDYYLEFYDPQYVTSEGWGSVNYSDDACSSPVIAHYNGEGSPLILTQNAGVTDSARIYPNTEGTSYVMEENTTISTVETVYYMDWENNCVIADWMSGETIVIPVVELDPMTHGLKDTYTSISVDGYVLN